MVSKPSVTVVRALLLGLTLAGCASHDTTRASASTSSAATPPAGAASPAPLKAGDAAPAFDLLGSDGKRHTLADHVGRQAVVIAWFPKAFTGG